VFDPRLSKVQVWNSLDERKRLFRMEHIRLRVVRAPDDGRRLLLDETTRRAAIVSIPRS
jgi:hypothetical protein